MLQSGPPGFDFPIDKLELTYIDECNDTDELTQIYSALKSGKYGYYPQLMRKCEKKILSLNPASDIFSSKPEPIESAAQDDEVTKDYNNWLNEYHPVRKSKTKSNLPVRKKQLINIDEKPKPPKASPSSEKTTKSEKTKRISGYDFRSWDKFDVDKACQDIDKSSSSSDENMKSQESRENSIKFKESGNRFFQQKKYIQAIEMYSKSLENDPENWAALNNRALCHMKLDDFSLGVDDTSRIIANDKNNVKALLRRAKCYNSLKQYDKAKDDLIQVQISDKKNGRKTGNDVIEMLKMVEKNLAPTYKKRMVIEDDSDSDSDIKNTKEITKDKQKNIQTLEKDDMNRNNKSGQKQQPTSNQPPWVKKSTPKVETIIDDSSDTQVDKLKQTADDAYRCGDYGKAATSYQACIVKVSNIETLDEESTVQLVNLHNNLAICNIKLGQHSKAIKQTNIILNELDEANEKARLRRGHCYEQIDCYLPAWHDYRAVLNKYPASATARAGIDLG